MNFFVSFSGTRRLVAGCPWAGDRSSAWVENQSVSWEHAMQILIKCEHANRDIK